MSGEASTVVAVCGAGAAGAAAAIAAARAGADVYLVEAREDLGGTMANALLHTLAGLYDSRGEYLNDGLARELAERLLAADAHVRPRRMGKLWVLNVDPELYRAVVRKWVLDERRIRPLFGTRVMGASCNGSRVRQLELAGPELSRLSVDAVVDTTGSAAVLGFVSSELRVTSQNAAAAGLVVRVRGVAPGTMAFPRNVALVRALREEADAGALPEECRHAWLDTGIYDDEVYLKLLVPSSGTSQSDSERAGLEQRCAETSEKVLTFLRRQAGFGEARVVQTGEIGVRDAGRAVGRYVLTRSDVLELRRFEDAACRCAWPIEYWDARGGASLEYLPEGGYYEIPLRALAARGVSNAWVAGKCLSADKHAQASARTVGTCWAMGEAVGRAAASTHRLAAS